MYQPNAGRADGRAKKWLYLCFFFLAVALPLVATHLAPQGAGPAAVLAPLSILAGIAVLTNVQSGKNRHGKFAKHGLEGIVGKDGIVIATQSVEEIDDAINTFMGRGERIICLNGGDGTIQRVVSRLYNTYGEERDNLPIIFPMRGGTMNAIADNFKIKGTPDKLCRRVVELEDSGRQPSYHALNTIRIERTTSEGSAVEYGFLYGNGALYRFHRLYYEETEGGPVASVQLLLRCLAAGIAHKTRYKDVLGGQTPMKVRIDGKEMIADEFTIVLAMQFKNLLLSFSPFREGEGDFYVIAASVPLAKMATKLHKLFWAREGQPLPLPEEHFYNSKAKVLEIETCEGHTFDGEVYALEEPHTLRITKGPKVKILKFD